MDGHSRAGGGRRPLLSAVVVGFCAILVGLGAVVLTRDDGRGDCVPLEVSSSTEKGGLLAALAEEYNDAGREFRVAGEDTCAEVAVSQLTSGLAMEALARGWDQATEEAPEPQVWTPSSGLWLDLLAERAAAGDRSVEVPDENPSLAQSPLTIAMPRPMAEALGWPDAELGWADVLSLTRNPEGWGAFGHPEWGSFSLGKDNPNTSTSGLAATVAAFYAATGVSSDLTREQVADPAARDFVAGVEDGVLHYADDAVTYMENLAEADASGQAMTYTSAVLVQEQLIHLYNQGAPDGDPERIGEGRRPEVPLVAIYPDDGTLMLDHPLVTLPSANEAQRAAADDLLAFLLEPDQQRRFAEIGFRDHEGSLSPELAESVNAEGDTGRELSLISPPAPQVLTAILDAWDEVRRNARVTLVMDVSGSMNQPAGDGRSRLRAAQDAALAALELYHPDDEVALWAFSTETADYPDTPYREVLPATRIGDGGTQRLTDAINGLHAEGGTALYTTTRAAQQAMLADYDPARINAIVVLSDGRNEYPADNDLDALLRDLDASRLERVVRVFGIAFGEDADLDTLDEIAAASRGAAYDAREPDTIDEVMRSVFSNF
ncbi:vWA domain-containing protein [Streptomyces mayteni]